MSASLLICNCTSGKPFISCSRIVYIRLPYQASLSLATYIQITRYQLINNYISRRLVLFSGSNIQKIILQFVQNYIHWDIVQYYWNCTSRGFYISLSRIKHIEFLFQECSIIALSIRLFGILYFGNA